MQTKTILLKDKIRTNLGGIKNTLGNLQGAIKYSILYKRYVSYLAQEIFRSDGIKSEKTLKYLIEIEDSYLQNKIVEELSTGIRHRSDIFYEVITNIIQPATDGLKYTYLQKELSYTDFYLRESNVTDQYRLLLETLESIKNLELKERLYDFAAEQLAKEFAHSENLFSQKNRQQFLHDGYFLKALDQIFYSSCFPNELQEKLQEQSRTLIQGIIKALDNIKELPLFAKKGIFLAKRTIDEKTAQLIAAALLRFLEFSENSQEYIDDYGYYPELAKLLEALEKMSNNLKTSHTKKSFLGGNLNTYW